jgi:tetratricopeptide (TPR) repeat protein
MPSVAEWRTQPVFISSTFRDMHAERDYLARVVFPALEERLHERRVDLVAIDLRWGVETLSVDEGERELHVLKVCLNEIERSRPFFIGLLGDRYGWMPPVGRMRKAIDEAGFAADVSGKSITALEIEFGVLADPQQRSRSFFYFRAPLPYERMDPATAALYSDAYADGREGLAAARRLAALKHRIEQDLPDRVRHYRATWDQARGAVTELTAFGERVLDDLWAALEAETHAFVAAPSGTWQEQERLTLRTFTEQRAASFVGRTALVNELLELATAPDNGFCGVVITGEAGLGKSALFGALHDRLIGQNDALVLAHSAGASARSVTVTSVLRRWIEELSTHLRLADQAESVDHREELEDLFANLLAQAAADCRTVLLLDAVDQFERTPVAQHLTWLPEPMPANVRLVATARSGTGTAALAERAGMARRELAPLSQGEARAIIQQVCAHYHRTLHDAVVAALLAHRLPSGQMAAGNPLWLQLVSEELLLLDQDDFARLGEFAGSAEEQLHALLLSTARAFSPSIPALYETLLQRTEDAYGRGWARELANLLAVSRAGLRESDVRAVLPRRSGQPWDGLAFATLRRGFRGHLVERGAAGQWDLAHPQARRAVLARNLSSEEERQAVHAALADHLLDLPAGDPMHCDETVVHLVGAGDQARAAAYYGGEISVEEREGATRALAAYLLSGSGQDPNPGLEWATGLLDSERFGTAIVERLCRAYTVELSAALRDDLPVRQQVALLEAVEGALDAAHGREPAGFDTARTLAAARTRLGDLERRRGNGSIARSRYESVLEMADGLLRLAPNDPEVVRNQARTHAALGDLAARSGPSEAAPASYARAREMIEDLVRRRPDSAEDVRDLEVVCGREAALYQDAGELGRALQLAKRALHLAEGFARSMPDNLTATRDLSVNQERMGTLLQQTGDLDAAREYYGAALALRRRLLWSAPDSMQFARDVWICHSKLGSLHQEANETKQSKMHLQKALTLARNNAERLPDSTDAQRDLANTYHNLGTMYQRAGQLSEAESYIRQSLGIAQDLRRLMPDNAEALQDQALTLRTLSTLYAQRGELERADAALRESLQVSRSLCQMRPESTAAARGLYLSCLRLGALSARRGDTRQAIPLVTHALSLARALHQQRLSSPHAAEDLASALREIGLLYLKGGRLHLAQRAYEESIALADDLLRRSPDSAGRAHDLVNALIGAAQVMDGLGRNDRSQQHLARCYEPLQVLQRADALTNPYLQQLWRDLKKRRRSRCQHA